MTRTAVGITLVALALAATTSRMLAGPLSPPPGAITSSYKTLSEVEPRTAVNAINTPGDADSVFRITSPGSYYLTSEILVPPGKRGIEIATDDVTLDLSGFRIAGFAGTLEGIAVVSPIERENITVRNGLINNMQGDGVRLATVNGVVIRNCRVEGVTVWNCTGSGVRVSLSSAVRDCSVARCGAGIYADSGCIIEGCSAESCTGLGFFATHDSILARCTAEANTGAGFEVATSSIVRECTAKLNQYGMVAIGDARIVDCVANENTLDGIAAGGDGQRVTGCTVTRNQRHGIVVIGKSTVAQNSCLNNGISGTGSNIEVNGSKNRIEENSCTGAAVGVHVTGTGNYIVRNTCASNTINWSIVSNNVVGAIIDRTAPASAAITGNSAPDSTGTSNPNANFTH